MKLKIFQIALLMLFVMSYSCNQNSSTTDLNSAAIIPKPVEVTAAGESFDLDHSAVIYFEEGVPGLQQNAKYLAMSLNRITGNTPAIKSADKLPMEGIFLYTVKEEEHLGDEEYEINIGKKLIGIKAGTPAGLFYGIQTLLQLLPSGYTSATKHKVATGTIRDFPEYSYRGVMLDVARHFFEVKDVKRFIDFLAAYKMNHLHLHLSDDQGWRIEIKSWPKLTEIGGSTEVGGGNGGFYTQEDYSEIVQYAQERQVTIVPEIDMPGHTNAALASYPELNCDGKATELYTGTKVGFSTLCTRKEVTYDFVNDVVREISALTPGPYFHIGGDESHVTEDDDYVYFVNRVQDIVTSHGKKVIGWDEIANAELVEDAVVQFWSNVENTKMAVEQGAKVIMSPAKKAYLDMKYDSTTNPGLNWAGYIEIDTGYIWNPATYVNGVTKEDILGVEAPLWSETVTNMDEIEYLVFPRLPGYAEIGWTAPEARKWAEYKSRLAKHGKRFEELEIDFYHSDLVPWEN